MNADKHGSLPEKIYPKPKASNLAEQHSSPKVWFLKPANPINPPFAPLFQRGVGGISEVRLHNKYFFSKFEDSTY
jgi:hypothetical protein